MKTAVTLHTAGTGYWSRTAKAVGIVDIRLGYVCEDREFGELCIYFDESTWNVKVDGLIYTDKQFRNELQAFLDAHGLPGKYISYSEQGMQGDDYVSCDVNEDFIDAWAAKFGEEAVNKMMH